MNKDQKMLLKSFLIIDDYLNAGGKEERTKAHKKAKKFYKKYTGFEYKNKSERPIVHYYTLGSHVK